MYSRDDAKMRAKKVRTILHELGYDISQANALEVIARQSNYRNWNTCAAALDMRSEILPIPPGWQAVGERMENYDIGLDQASMY